MGVEVMVTVGGGTVEKDYVLKSIYAIGTYFEQ